MISFMFLKKVLANQKFQGKIYSEYYFAHSITPDINDCISANIWQILKEKKPLKLQKVKEVSYWCGQILFFSLLKIHWLLTMINFVLGNENALHELWTIFTVLKKLLLGFSWQWHYGAWNLSDQDTLRP